MAAGDPGPASLALEEAERIFAERIVPALLSSGRASAAPRAVVLSAQAGAGKSVLARDLRASFGPADRPVPLDVDAFRQFHPGYRRLLRTDPDAAEAASQTDARRWLSWSIDHAVERGWSVIVEHGLRTKEVFDEVLAQLSRPDRDYRIEGALLATPAAVSRLGILARYQFGQELTGGGRYVSEDAHDARFEHLRTVADWMMADNRFEAVAVYERGQVEATSRFERNPTGSWTPSGTVRSALDTARRRPWTLEESRGFVRVHHSLSARMEARWEPVLHRAWQAAEPVLHTEVSTPRFERPAVTFGRYQIVSIAHLDTIRTILLDWPTVEIGVLDLDRLQHPTGPVPAHLRQFYADCSANTAPAKNPMTVEERVRFWEATLSEAGLDTRATVTAIARPELDPDTFNHRYPPERFDLVFPTASGDGFDLTRNTHMSEILGRPVETVEPPLEYHTSDIRTAYQAGDDIWRNGLAPGGIDEFIAADGPRRLLGENPTPDTTTRHKPDPARIPRSASKRRPGPAPRQGPSTRPKPPKPGPRP